MRKRILTLAVMTTLALMLMACGQPTNGETYGEDYGVKTEMNGRFETIVDDDKDVTPTATAAPTIEPEATVAPTAEPTEEPKPTEVPEVTTPTIEQEPTDVPEIVEPTAMPEPTVTPAPTATPKPTKAPVAETKNFETVLRELHSLRTYEEREAYIEKLDKSKYKVEETNNRDFFSKGNSYEGYDPDMGETRTFKPDALDRAFDEFSFVFYDELYEEYGDFEARYGYSSWLQYTYEYSLMTITDVTTGETDPWGAKARYSEERLVWDENWEEVIDTEIVEIVHPTIIEPVIDAYNSIFAWDNFYYYAMIKTWDTLKYYDDIYTPQTEFETGHQ